MDKTIFKDYSNEVITEYNHIINLDLSTTVQLESSPDSEPILTLYRVDRKNILINLTGRVIIIYTLNRLNNGIKQKYFLK